MNEQLIDLGYAIVFFLIPEGFVLYNLIGLMVKLKKNIRMDF